MFFLKFTCNRDYFLLPTLKGEAFQYLSIVGYQRSPVKCWHSRLVLCERAAIIFLPITQCFFFFSLIICLMFSLTILWLSLTLSSLLHWWFFFSVMKPTIQIPWRDSDGGYFLQDDVQKYRDLMVEFKICF